MLTRAAEPGLPVFTVVAQPLRAPAWTAARLIHSQALLALADQAVISLTNFSTGLILGRVAGKTELGLYALAGTLLAIGAETAGALTVTPYTVFAPRLAGTARQRYLGSMLLQQVALLGVMAAAMLLAAAVAGLYHGGDAGGRAAVTGGAVMVFFGMAEFVRRACFADLRIGQALALDASAGLARMAGLALLWRAHCLTASTVYGLVADIALAIVGAWLFLYRRRVKIDRRDLLPGFRQNWTFGKWVLSSNVLWTASVYLYPWLLTAFHGAAVTGAWAACAAIVAAGNPVFGGFGSYVAPKIANLFAQGGIAAMRRYVYRSSGWMAAVLAPLVVALWFGGGAILVKTYGPAYAGNATVIALLALNLLFTSFTYPFSRGLFTLQAARADMLINVVALVLLFTVGMAAIKTHAAAGAAAAMLLSTVVAATIRVAAFERAARAAQPVPCES